MNKKQNSARAGMQIRRGTDNVFADLAFADADTHLLKAKLVSRMDAIMRARKLTQARAAELAGVSQPDVSRLLRGRFRDVSVERIMRMLTRLGCDIEIVVRSEGDEADTTIIQLERAAA
jgi:predicted XRE-type DNA-binding protein